MKAAIRFLIGLMVVVSTLVAGARVFPAIAADLANGAQVFSANCAACHVDGKNLVNASKTLQKSDLEKYGMASTEAIINQVMNGKLAMPAFQGRLSDNELEDVAAYVLDQAEKGW